MRFGFLSRNPEAVHSNSRSSMAPSFGGLRDILDKDTQLRFAELLEKEDKESSIPPCLRASLRGSNDIKARETPAALDSAGREEAD